MVTPQGVVNRLKLMGFQCRKQRGEPVWVCYHRDLFGEVKVDGINNKIFVVLRGEYGELANAIDKRFGGDIDELVEGLRNVSRADEMNFVAYLETHMTFGYKMDNWDKALRFIKALIEVQPYYEITNLVGELRVEVRDYRTSIRYLIESLKEAMKKSELITMQ